MSAGQTNSHGVALGFILGSGEIFSKQIRLSARWLAVFFITLLTLTVTHKTAWGGAWPLPSTKDSEQWQKEFEDHNALHDKVTQWMQGQYRGSLLPPGQG